MNRKISLVTMGCGNMAAFKKTLNSFNGICEEIVFGSMLLFKEDKIILDEYASQFNIKIIEYPFNYLFLNGFSSILNSLCNHARNNLTLYMNVSEIIDEDYGINNIIDSNPDCNSFYFIHRTDGHRWFRIGDKNDLKWSGMLHESLEGEFRPYHKPIFMMADEEKDLQNPLKAKIFNDQKEINYFRNYMRLVEEPDKMDGTDPGWHRFATDNYESMKERLIKKGTRYQAFIDGDLEAYMYDVMNNPEFEKERFESNNLIAYQGDKIHLL